MELECAVCGAIIPIAQPLSWQCPNVSSADRRHVMRFRAEPQSFEESGESNPFVAFRHLLAVDAFGASIGLDDVTRRSIIEQADADVARIAGTGFRVTPLERADRLSDALGFSDRGGVWVKDDTHNVAGSHKARHLFGILLHLLMGEKAGVVSWSRGTRPPLAIASCGNAAIAASTLARSANWPIHVFVPVGAAPATLSLLEQLGANVVECPRRSEDPPGDPCIHRFREAVANGAVPFSVQGTENAWCLDGGRTIGWEIASQVSVPTFGAPLGRLFVQVGGGAFISCAAEGLRAGGIATRIHGVQTEGCAPLVRAWQRATALAVLDDVAHYWPDCMWPWETMPSSLADGILDDETYDWVSAIGAMARTGGFPVMATEELVHAAFAMSHDFTDIDVSPTGSAGLAGVLQMRHDIGDDERIAVMFSGVRRN